MVNIPYIEHLGYVKFQWCKSWTTNYCKKTWPFFGGMVSFRDHLTLVGIVTSNDQGMKRARFGRENFPNQKNTFLEEFRWWGSLNFRYCTSNVSGNLKCSEELLGEIFPTFPLVIWSADGSKTICLPFWGRSSGATDKGRMRFHCFLQSSDLNIRRIHDLKKTYCLLFLLTA